MACSTSPTIWSPRPSGAFGASISTRSYEAATAAQDSSADPADSGPRPVLTREGLQLRRAGWAVVRNRSVVERDAAGRELHHVGAVRRDHRGGPAPHGLADQFRERISAPRGPGRATGRS